jgi:type I restriction enzyme, S subunit
MQNSWPNIRLEDVCIRVTDGTHQSPRFETGGVPFLVISDVVSGEIDWSGVSKWVDEQTYEANTARCRPDRGDVLYTAVGSFGVAVPVETDRRFMFQRHIAHIKPDLRRVHTRFLAYFLNSPAVKAMAERVAKGGAQRTVTLGDLKNFRIPLPPITEQHRIAGILDKADAIRRKRKEAIALAEELLRSAFLEMFGDPVTNPKRWPATPLGQLAEAASGVTKGKRYDGQKLVTLPYMRVANVQDGHLVLDEVKTIAVSEDDGRRYTLQHGDVLLTEGGDPDKLGRGAVWRAEVPNCIHQNHIFRVRPSRALRAEYLSAIIGSERGKRYFLRAAKQTTGIATINMSQLKAFPVLVPPLSLQDQYVDLISKISTARGHQERKYAVSDELFASLAARAFSGELSSAEAPC